MPRVSRVGGLKIETRNASVLEWTRLLARRLRRSEFATMKVKRLSSSG